MKIIETLKNVWKITELKDRILLTLGLLLVYRFGAQVVLPGVDFPKLSELQSSAAEGGLLWLINAFTGGGFSYTHFFHFRFFTPSISPSFSLPSPQLSHGGRQQDLLVLHFQS